MQKEDCFFLLEGEEDISTKKIKTCCVKCMQENKIEKAWFWEGSKRGYGPFLFKCDFCEKTISEPEVQ